MPLKNRLEEVINRYERASRIVKRYKEGELSEEELTRSFKQLRKDRKLVDLHNRRFLTEERRRCNRMHDIDEEEEDTNTNTTQPLLPQQQEEEEEASDVESGNESEVPEEDKEDEEIPEEETTGSNEADDEARDTDATMTAINMPPSQPDPAPVPVSTLTQSRMSRRKEEKLWKQYGSFWRNV